MERIYKTKWGAYIDLSEILAIDYKSILFCFSNIDKNVERYDIMVYTSIKDNIIIAERKEPEFFEDLVNAWKEYIKTKMELIFHRLLN